MTAPLSDELVEKLKGATAWRFTSQLGPVFSPRFMCCTSPNEMGLANGKDPVAVLRLSPNPAAPGATVTFDGTDSYDPDGTVTGWSWTFESGTPGSSSADSGTVSWAAEGVYAVTLVVTDGTGLKSSPARVNIVVQEGIGPIVLAYRDNSDGYGKAAVVQAGSITLGSIATFEAASTNWTSVCVLSATQALVCYQDAGNSNQGTACILDISGTAITPGTPVVFETGTTTHIDVCALSGTAAIVSYRDEGNSNRGTACVLSVSGSTITPGTPAVYETDATLYCSITALSATRAITCYRDDATGFGTACVLEVSGTTITPNTPDVWHSAAVVRTGCATIDSTSILVSCAVNAGDSLVAFVLHDIATGFTAGSGATLDNVRGAFDSAEPGNHWVQVANPTTALIAYQTDNLGVSPFRAFVAPVYINGAVLTGGTPVEVGSFSNSYDEIVTVALVSETKAIIFYGDGASNGRALSIDFTSSTITENADEVEVNSVYTRYTSIARLV